MPTNNERIRLAFDALTSGLFPFVERRMKLAYGDQWIAVARESFRDDRVGNPMPRGEVIRWDAHSLLTVMWDQWNRVFKSSLAPYERSLISELREFRNRWAHQEKFWFDDSYRVLDSAERMLKSVEAAAEVAALAASKRDLLWQEFTRQSQASRQNATARRKRIQDILLYAACCASVLFTIYHALDSNQFLMGVLVIAGFSYLTWLRMSTSKPLLYGARECPECSKIIYRESCPYCEPPRFFARAPAESAEHEAVASI